MNKIKNFYESHKINIYWGLLLFFIGLNIIAFGFILLTRVMVNDIIDEKKALENRIYELETLQDELENMVSYYEIETESLFVDNAECYHELNEITKN